MPSIEWNKRWGTEIKYWNNKIPYGAQWGNPEKTDERSPGDLSRVAKEFILPYIKKDSNILEIGPGGGRWTKYLLNCKKLILVDLNPEFFPYLANRFKDNISKISFYQTNDYELEGIKDNSIDFIFSFGTFVHIEPYGIREYLKNIKDVLKKEGIAVIQYSDKNKEASRNNPSFSDMNKEKMESIVNSYGFKILKHNYTILNHSNIIVFRR